jgi:hypothetical protein
MVFNSSSFVGNGSLEDYTKMFGPKDCWCTFRGQTYFICNGKGKTKLCKETYETFQKEKKKYLALKRKKSKKQKNPYKLNKKSKKSNKKLKKNKSNSWRKLV